MLKGQISVFTAIIAATGMIITSAITSWATSSRNVSEVQERIAVVDTREDAHYQEVQKQLEKIDKKLDALLLQKR